MKRARAVALRLPTGATVGVYLTISDPAHIAPIGGWHECTVRNATDSGAAVRGPDGSYTFKAYAAMFVPTAGNRWKRVDHAAKHPNAGGLWWWSAEGDARRVATTLEVALYNDGIVPASGWRLATPENEELYLPKPEFVWCAPFECCALDTPKPEKPKPVYRTADDKRLAHARAMLRQAVTRVKRATTIEKKWAKTVRRLERKTQ